MSVARVMPEQKPGRSVQVVCTPDDFLGAFRARFGEISWDLAANADNSVVDFGCFYGPGSDSAEDSLAANWWGLSGNLWLNPEFSQIRAFSRKALESGMLVNLFVPLSSANWARDFVWGKAMVYPLNPRIVFKGHKTAYPKDMMLVRYGTGEVGCELWKWR